MSQKILQYPKDAVGAFVVSDLSRLETLDTVIAWKEELDSKVQLADGSKIPCFLLGNKVYTVMFNQNSPLASVCRIKTK